MQHERLVLIHVTPDEMQIIQAYRQVSPECRHMLIDMAGAAAAATATAKQKPENVTYLTPVNMR